MTSAQIKFGLFLVTVQILLLAVTMAFHAQMDASAERAGIANIINEATR